MIVMNECGASGDSGDRVRRQIGSCHRWHRWHIAIDCLSDCEAGKVGTSPHDPIKGSVESGDSGATGDSGAVANATTPKRDLAIHHIRDNQARRESRVLIGADEVLAAPLPWRDVADDQCQTAAA